MLVYIFIGLLMCLGMLLHSLTRRMADDPWYEILFECALTIALWPVVVAYWCCEAAYQSERCGDD